MEYNHTVLPDRFSVEGIVTVLHHTFASGEPKQKGEAHDFPEILYIHKGVHRPVVDGTEYTLSAGQMMIYAPRSLSHLLLEYGCGGVYSQLPHRARCRSAPLQPGHFRNAHPKAVVFADHRRRPFLFP